MRGNHRVPHQAHELEALGQIDKKKLKDEFSSWLRIDGIPGGGEGSISVIVSVPSAAL